MRTMGLPSNSVSLRQLEEGEAGFEPMLKSTGCPVSRSLASFLIVDGLENSMMLYCADLALLIPTYLHIDGIKGLISTQML